MTPGLRVRLVARVDDGAAIRGVAPHQLLHVVGALRDLEAAALRLPSDPHATGAHEHRARDEERDQHLDEILERDGAVHEVVLVAAVGGALPVHVVLVDDRARAGAVHSGAVHAGAGHRTAHHSLAREVVAQGLARPERLRGGVLRVRVVDVEARPVAQHLRGAALPAALEVVEAGEGVRSA